MKTYQFLLLLLLITGLEISAFCWYRQAEQADFLARLDAAKIPTRPVLYAKQDIAEDSELRPAMFEVIDTQTNILKQAFSPQNVPWKQPIILPFKKGDPLTAEHLPVPSLDLLTTNYTKVLFATQDLAPGQRIFAYMVRAKDTPTDLLKNAYTKDDLSRVLHAVPLYPISDGDPLTTNNLQGSP